MKSILLYVLILFSFISITSSQTNKPYLEESKPLSPGAYQFLKYNGLPVSEYTGIPEVSVPIYEINEDGVSVPISLNYHASGITVNEEATAIGLGWNLQFGSVIQIVNDQSDLDPKKTKLLPDYIGSQIPSVLPLRYPTWPLETTGGPTSFPISSPITDYTFPITTGHYFPVNGDYTVDQTQLLTGSDYDSEPDIFKANFLGYSVNFIKDFKNGGQIVVLNKSGYQVQYLSDGSWCITVPSGDQYYFALKNVTSSSVSTAGLNASLTVSPESSVMWSLTKILTKNKKEIDFNYTQTISYKHIPNFSQTWKKYTTTATYNLSSQQIISAFWSYLVSLSTPYETTTNTFNQSEPNVIPSSIVFPLGRVDFYNSDRTDVLGGKKIDSIKVSGDHMSKIYKLNYSYLNSSSVGGNGFTYDFSPYGNGLSSRLRLDSFIDPTGGVYRFNYDPTLLPNKNSFALDQWGYYNGTLTNTSLIPNPTQYNKPELGNNGDNHSANLFYTRASTLNQIIYPTGGSVNFDFELNTFSNYWVPDYNSSSNTVSQGNGLRVKQITWKQSDNSIAKIQQFTYTDGKALLPINLYRNYQFSAGNGNYSNGTINSGAGAYFYINNYSVDEFNGNGYYSQSSLAAMSGVGYTQVTSKYLDQSNNSIGSEVTTFNNNPAILPYNSVQFLTKVSVSLPGREDLSVPKNGLIKSIQYYDQSGIIKKKSTNTYVNYPSALFYGARIYGYGNYIYYVPASLGSVPYWTSQLQTMVADYPIYDFESLLSTTNDVAYFKAGDSVVTTTAAQYNSNRLLTNNIKRGANYKEEIRLNYAVLPAMITQNRLSDITYKYRSIITTTATLPDRAATDAYTFQRTFVQINDKFLPSLDIEKNLNQTSSTNTTYDAYDSFGNVSQVTDKTGTTSLIWSYNGKYLIAKITNAKITDCAYTSFEQKMLEMYGDWQVFPSIPAASREAIVYGSYPLDSRTGIYSNNAGDVISKVVPAKDYIFTLYAKGTGTITVNGSSQTISGGWKRYDWYLANATQVILKNTGALLDDLCFYPPGAQMTTYSYKPLVGLASETDPKGKTSFYEYDNFQRLKTVKDQNGNIVKNYDYHLIGQ